MCQKHLIDKREYARHVINIEFEVNQSSYDFYKSTWHPFMKRRNLPDHEIVWSSPEFATFSDFSSYWAYRSAHINSYVEEHEAICQVAQSTSKLYGPTTPATVIKK
jgi:hypothetical protein